MLVDRRNLSKEPVQRYHRGNGRENRQQSVEHDPGRNGEHSIFIDLLVGPPKNVLPASPRNLPGCSRVPATPRLVGALVLNLSGFIRAAGSPHCATGRSPAVRRLATVGRSFVWYGENDSR